jgi:hypothetical protein
MGDIGPWSINSPGNQETLPMRDPDAFETIHFYAALLVLIVSFNTPLDVIERICTMSVLEKYGLCLSLVLVLRGVRGMIAGGWALMRSRHPDEANKSTSKR